MCFKSMAVIVEKLYSSNHKNMNPVHKDIKALVSVKITMGGNISLVENLFYDGLKKIDLG